ncbi:MAG: hypothetical protein AB7I13_11450 [Vicinamibacterales bacterium]
MTVIRQAHVVVFYLFDVAESIELSAVSRLVGGPAVPARLSPKPPTPAYVQYGTPPVSFDGELVGAGTLDEFRVRFRVYDYGVLSIALTRAVSGGWPELRALGQTIIENEGLDRQAEALCHTALARLRPALTGARDTHLREDYVVYHVSQLDEAASAATLLASHGADIAAMLRGERQALSDQEREHVLRHALSYLNDDVVVAAWNAAFVYDTPAGAQAALEIIEFANSQLLQFRYYDERLDADLAAIYKTVQQPRWFDQWIGSRYTRAARQVHALFIEVSEVTDRTGNSLKFTGDVYAARLFTLVADRFGLMTWKGDVEGKLNTLADLHRFTVEQSSMARGQLLELAIVLILVFELALFFAGIMP